MKTILPHALSLSLLALTGMSVSAQNLSVNTSSRESVRVFHNAIYPASDNVPINWTGNIAACNPGAVSQAYLDATLLPITYFRAMAGLFANVTFVTSNNVMAQATAMLMSAN